MIPLIESMIDDYKFCEEFTKLVGSKKFKFKVKGTTETHKKFIEHILSYKVFTSQSEQIQNLIEPDPSFEEKINLRLSSVPLSEYTFTSEGFSTYNIYLDFEDKDLEMITRLTFL